MTDFFNGLDQLLKYQKQLVRYPNGHKYSFYPDLKSNYKLKYLTTNEIIYLGSS